MISLLLIIFILNYSVFGNELSGGFYDNIELLQSDNQGLRFRILIDDPADYVEYGRTDSTYTMVIPVLIGVPLDARPIIANITAADYNVLPASISNVRESNLGQAEIAGPKIVRGRKLATVNVYPVRNGRYARVVEVTIDFVKDGLKVSREYSYTPDPVFERLYRQAVLNYGTFKGWPKLVKDRTPAKTSDHMFGQVSSWYKVAVTRSGLTRITGSQLAAAGMNLNNLNSADLRLFYGGGEPLPFDNSIPRPDFNEVAIQVFDGNDAIFNLNDSLIFFAEAADRWRFPVDSEPAYLNNHYTDTNYYWLAASGAIGTGSRIPSIDGAPVGVADTIITDTWFHIHEEQNNLLFRLFDDHIFDFYNWYWSDKNQNTFYIPTPGITPPDSAAVRIRARAANDSILLLVNGIPATRISSAAPEFSFYTSNLDPGGLNHFLLYLKDNYNASPHFDFCEVTYRGGLSPTGNLLDFYIDDISGIAEMVVANDFTADPRLWDVTDPLNPIEITNLSISQNDIVFQADFGALSSRRFYMTGINNIHDPGGIRAVTVDNLRNVSSQVDMIIVTPRQFIDDLEEYVQYREEKSDLSIQTLAVEDIYDQFAYGLFDPSAIRDFLKFASEYYPEPQPSIVLFVGDGHYDFENHMRYGGTNYIPPYIHPLDETASDDNYVYFGRFGILDSDSSYITDPDTLGFDMMAARWPVRNGAEIATIVDKIKTYETAGNFGRWRSTVTFVADDEYQNSGIYEGITHARQSEQLSRNHLPNTFLRKKIFLWEYPLNNEGDKPDVNREIVATLNDGTLVVNYVGHGNPDTWSHEHVFNRGSDLPKLNNHNRLPLIFAASCSIGFFDDPAREGMSEEMLRMPAGAIAAISAVRLVFSTENASFNRQVFDFLFGSRELTMCEAVYAAKLVRQFSFGYPLPKINDRKFAYFGDPCLKLGVPQHRIEYTDKPDQFIALGTHQVAGNVIDKNDSSLIAFNGSTEVTVFDSKINKFHKGERDADTITYSVSGPVIYRGQVDVTDGQFDLSFIVPLDVGYGGQGGAVFGYAVSPGADAFGLADSIPISPDIAVSTDSVGPTIGYTFSERTNFVSGDRISPSETLVLNLADSSGVNLTGSSGHRIILIIDNNMEDIVNLTDLFEYDAESFVSGSIRYQLQGLAMGNHQFKVKAWDNANNSAVVEFNASVVGEGDFMLTDVLNYPNPMTETTMFSFNITGPARTISLEIFTLAGKKILSYSQNAVAADYHRFYSWNGFDADGDRVATGVYIYKVTAASSVSDEVAESYGKVVVIN